MKSARSRHAGTPSGVLLSLLAACSGDVPAKATADSRAEASVAKAISELASKHGCRADLSAVIIAAKPPDLLDGNTLSMQEYIGRVATSLGDRPVAAVLDVSDVARRDGLFWIEATLGGSADMFTENVAVKLEASEADARQITAKGWLGTRYSAIVTVRVDGNATELVGKLVALGSPLEY
jgi:hypothetical protein